MKLQKLDTQSRDRHGMFQPDRLEARISRDVVLIEVWTRHRRAIDLCMSNNDAQQFAAMLIALDANGSITGLMAAMEATAQQRLHALEREQELLAELHTLRPVVQPVQRACA